LCGVGGGGGCRVGRGEGGVKELGGGEEAAVL